MNSLTLETAQHIQIMQQPASLWERILAYLIDVFFLGVYIILASLTVFGLLEQKAEGSIALLTGLSLPFFLYHLLFELLMNGQSPGKHAMDIRVVKLDGSKVSFADYLIRWILRPIDLTISSGGIAVLVILLGGKGKRLGDLAAGTAVISLKKRGLKGSELLTKVAETHTPKFPQVINLNDAQIRNMKEIRLEALTTQDFKLIQSLADKTAEILQISYETKALEFINQVILDYEFYAQREE
ncbi:RDD family protein [Algoriphagus confluentis]|uniref:RDD family protein n=1 Tax=Algoriphagus confluentis TaxID=1697556 RepID=A0ABQ6PIW5_9BACT|nr:RDD family protein [Algoriphagus confluentis]